MANPVVDVRPQKTVGGFVSKWNAGGGNLPIQYEITNTKFPANSEDTTYTISTIADENGYAKVTVTGSASSIVDDSWIKITGTTSYNGIHRVRNSVSNFVKVIDTAFIANETGSLQQYYNNYVTNVKVYAGIDSAHPLTSSDPIGLIGTIQQKPDSDNTTYVDVSKYVKTKLSSNNERDSSSDWPNDINLWTDFYIVVYETYEAVRGTTVTGSDVDDSANILHAVYAALQFGDFYGGNMYEYIVSDAANFPEAKFLTLFEEYEYFLGGAEFDLSFISEIGTFDLVLSQYDQNANFIKTDTISYSGKGRGVYRLELEDVDIETDTIYLIATIEDAYNTYTEQKRINYNTSLCVDVTEAPTNLTAELDDNFTDVNLAWIDMSVNENRFEIFRSTDNVTFTKIGQVGENIQLYTDTNTSSNTTYYYKVRAVGKDGIKSAFTNVASILVPLLGGFTFDTTNTETGSSNSNTLYIPIISSTQIKVDWDDGSQVETFANPSSGITHVYSSPGTYNVSISGVSYSLQYKNLAANDRLKLETISSFGNLDISESETFYGCSNLNITDTNTPTISTNDLTDTFNGCSSLTYNSSIDSWDVSSVTILQSMFFGATSFNQSINSWDVSNVTDIGSLFNSCTSFNQSLSSWQTGNITNFRQVFYGASNYSQSLNSWDVSSGTNFESMLRQTSYNQSLSNWVISSAVNMNFFVAQTPFNQNINNWVLPASLTKMQGFFLSCTLYNQPLDNWNVQNVQDFGSMFNGATIFNQDITGWNTMSATNFRNMFSNTNAFNSDISSWNTANVVKTEFMFDNAVIFNRNLGNWLVTNNLNANAMFRNSALNTANLDAILNGWAAQAPNIKNNVVFGAEDTARSSASDAAVTLLTGAPYNWTINTL